jgi:PAS domain S-box-containing protein
MKVLKGLSRLLSPPKFEDSEKNSKAMVFYYLVAGFMGLIALVELIFIYLLPENLMRWVYLILFFSISCSFLLFLNKKGHLLTASYLFIFISSALIFAMAYTAGGIRAFGIQILPVLVLTSGLFLGRKNGIIVGILVSVCSFGLVILEYNNLLPRNTVNHNPLTIWLNNSTIIGLTIILQYLSIANIDKALLRAKAEIILRAETEEKFRLSELRYRSIFENANDAIFLMKNDIFIECNSKTLEIFGCKRDQIINHSPYSFSPEFQPDGQASKDKAIGYIRLAINGVPQNFEWQHCRFDKSLFDAEVSLNRLEVNNEMMLQAIVRDVTERKRAEELLREKERKIRAVYDLSYGFIGLLSPEGLLLEANHTSIEFAGIKPKDVIGKPFWETPWWNHSQEMQKKLQNAINEAAKGNTIRYEATHPDINGKVHIIDFSLKPVFDEYGKVIFIIPEGRDITERKEAEFKLAEAQIKLTSVLESTNDLIWSVDAENFKLLTFNHGLKDYFQKNYNFELKEGVNPSKILPPPYNSLWPSMYKRVLNEGSFQTEYALSSGSTILLLSFNPLKYNDKIFGISVFGRDITAIKTAERSTLTSESKYRRLHTSMTDGYVFVDMQGKILEFNEAYRKMLGYDKKELTALNYADITPLKWHQFEADIINNQLIKTGISDVYEKEYLRKDGTIFPVELHTFILKNEDGENEGMWAIVREITERKRAEEELRSSENRFRLILENMPILLNAFDENGNIIAWNKACEDVTGYSAEEVIGNSDAMTKFYPDPEYRAKVWNTSLDPLNKNTSFDLVAKNGDIKTIEWFDTYLRLTIPGWASWGMGVDVTDQRKAEKELKASNELLSLFMQNSPIYAFIKEVSFAESRVLKVSGNYQKMVGIPSTEMVGKTMHELFPPAFADKITADDWSVVTNNKLIELEENLNGRNYTTIKFPIRQGERNLLAGYTIDITESKIAEEALKASEERFRELSNLLPQTVFETDLNGKLTYVNQMAFKSFGYSPLDFENGLNAFNMLIPEDRIIAKERMLNILSENKPSINEYTVLRKDGSTFPTVLYSNAIVRNNKVVGLRGLIFDITDRKLAENVIKESGQRFEMLLNTVTDYIYSVKIENGNVIETIHGEGCIAVTGYTTKEFYADQFLWYDIVYDNDKNIVKSHSERIINELEDLPIEHRICHKNGSIRWVRNTPVLKLDSENKLIGYDGLIADITELKEAQRQILNATIEAEERERNNFARELHDGLGPILSTIKLYFQWLNKTELLTPKEEIMANVESTIQEAISSVKEISHRLSPHVLMNFGLVFALKSFIEKLQKTTKLNITLETNIEERFEKEIETTFYRVIIECINNTIKYANASNIQIRLNHISNQVGFEYTDDGVGFDFDQVRKTGKGLGLFNMQNRITSLGGSISIESWPNKGIKIKAVLNLDNKL